jgi:putative salt-induced outer membrane protein YdiY
LKKILLTLIAFIPFAAATRADVVTLKNGDRVTGTFVTVKDGKLELKSDILGDLQIPVDKIASFSAEKPAAVVMKGQEPVEGTLALAPNGDWQVTAAGKAETTIAAANVTLIMPAETYDALENHTAKPWQDWKGNLSLGYAVQNGNQNTSSFSTNITAFRERPAAPIFKSHFRTDFTLTTLLSYAAQTTTNTEGGTTTTTVDAHTLSSTLRESYLFSPSNSVFVIGQLDHISPESLYLRQTAGGGYSRILINNARWNFSVQGGITYIHEKFFTGAFDESAAALAGETLAVQFTKRVKMTHNFTFFPSFSSTAGYRFNTATNLAAAIGKGFSLNTGFTDFYLSNPPPAGLHNNPAFITGLGYAF